MTDEKVIQQLEDAFKEEEPTPPPPKPKKKEEPKRPPNAWPPR